MRGADSNLSSISTPKPAMAPSLEPGDVGADVVGAEVHESPVGQVDGARRKLGRLTVDAHLDELVVVDPR